MINGLFEEVSEEEMRNVNGACGGSANPYAAMMICQECQNKGNTYAKNVVVSTAVGYKFGGLSCAVSNLIISVITGVPEAHSEHAK